MWQLVQHRLVWISLHGYVGHVTVCHWMSTIACCLKVGLGLGLKLGFEIRFSVRFVRGYAHCTRICTILSVVIVTPPYHGRILSRVDGGFDGCYLQHGMGDGRQRCASRLADCDCRQRNVCGRRFDRRRCSDFGHLALSTREKRVQRNTQLAQSFVIVCLSIDYRPTIVLTLQRLTPLIVS